MSHYVEGFVVPVPTAKKEAYRKMAEMVAPIYREYGAISVVECWGDDVPMGVLTSFPRAVQCTEDETVVFSWIIWPSREARDAGNAKVMSDPRLHMPEDGMPFDGQRMIMGGFQVMLQG